MKGSDYCYGDWAHALCNSTTIMPACPILLLFIYWSCNEDTHLDAVDF